MKTVLSSLGACILFAGLFVGQAAAQNPEIISPSNGCESAGAPTFEWSSANLDFFKVVLVCDYTYVGWSPFSFWYTNTDFSMTSSWWSAVNSGSGCAWGVFGMNTTTGQYGWSGWQWVGKFVPEDCGGSCWPSLQGCDGGYCFVTTEGFGNCTGDFFCGASCASSDDCGCGQLCYTCTACGGNVCGPIH